MSLRNGDQRKCFICQNLTKLVKIHKQFTFWRSKIYFPCYAPFNREPFLTHLVLKSSIKIMNRVTGYDVNFLKTINPTTFSKNILKELTVT